MTIERLDPPGLATPNGYTHVTVSTGRTVVHVSGQVALDADGRVVGAGDVAAQTRQVFDNLERALAAAGTDLAHVARMSTYLVGLTPERLGAYRAVREARLGDGPRPASTLIGVAALVHPDLLVEIDVTAVLA